MECRTMHQHSPFLVMCLAQFLGAVLLSRRKINTFKLTDGPKQCILGENSMSLRRSQLEDSKNILFVNIMYKNKKIQAS